MHTAQNNILKNNQSGQTLIEFILLIGILVILSFALIKGMNGYIQNRWVSIIKIIARPTASNIELF